MNMKDAPSIPMPTSAHDEAPLQKPPSDLPSLFPTACWPSYKRRVGQQHKDINILLKVNLNSQAQEQQTEQTKRKAAVTHAGNAEKASYSPISLEQTPNSLPCTIDTVCLLPQLK